MFSVMDVMQACRCCLRCPPDKDLTTPYTHLGGTEIYADMLKQCFDIQLLVGEDVPCGICSACVGRLRDASDFKLQVQRSQAELQARLQGFDPLTKEEPSEGDESSEELELSEDPLAVPELLSEDKSPQDKLSEEPAIKSELLDEDGTSEKRPILEAEVKEEASDAASDEDCPAREEPSFKPELLDEEMLLEVREVKEQAPVAASDEDCPAPSRDAIRAFQQLQRLRGERRHRSIHIGQKPYTSERCGKKLPNNSTSRKHAQRIHSSTLPKSFACCFCGSTFQSESLVSEHEKNEHRVTNLMRSKCNYATFNEKSLLTYQKSHTISNLFKSGQCSDTTRSKSNLPKHQPLHVHTGDKPLKSTLCSFNSNRKSALQQHREVHSDEKPYSCNSCEYKSRTKELLRRHQMKHTGENPYKCDSCDYKCRTKGMLRRHQMKHTGENPYKCDICDYKCRQKGNLKCHQMKHTGENPYKCESCDYKCRRKESLRCHKMTHTGERPYKCNSCGYKFSLRADLRRHQMIHSGEKPYKCNSCDYKCRQKMDLRRHQMTHTGEKPYECDSCGYRCSERKHLKRHWMIHIQKRPYYRCNHCNYGIRFKKALEKHLKTIHTL